MGFAAVFPATTWVVRKLISKSAKRIWLFLLILILPLLCISIVLRIDGVISVLRINRVLTQLSSLQSGVTSREEVLQRVPGLHPSGSPYIPERYPSSEYFSLELTNSKLSSWGANKVSSLQSERLFALTHWLGLRYWVLWVTVRIQDGKVSGYRYHLRVSNTERLVNVHAESLHDFRRETQAVSEERVDQSPDYQVDHYFKWPEFDTGIQFTEKAQPELKRHAFDANLRCLWGFTACWTANQILPLAEEDRKRIEQALLDRVRSSNPCPESILPRRARDSRNIFLVEITGFREGRPEELPEPRYVTFKIIKVLKGDPNGLGIMRIGVEPKVVVYPNPPMDNPATPLIQPGRRVLLFSDDDSDSHGLAIYVGSLLCDAMPATDSAVRSLEQALASNASLPTGK